MQLNFIADQSVASHSGRTLPVIDPSDVEPFDDIQRSDERDIDDAVRAARQCFESPWSALSAAEVVRTPLPISTMRYRCPQRTTLLLPEEPEYNEMNSAMKNL